jgi:hypothetical protein
MTRRWLVRLPLVLAVAAAVTLPVTASAAPGDDPPTTCSKDTQEVADLTTAATNLGTALGHTPLDATTPGQASGDLFTAVTAAQTAGCLPALPVSPPAEQPQDASDCAADTVGLLSAALGEISAAIATPPDQARLLSAATTLAGAVAAIDTDTCLPVALPVPTVPPVS